MTKSTKKSRLCRSIFWILISGSLIAGMMYYEATVERPEPTKAEIDAKVRKVFDIVCLDGVEYWVNRLHYTHGGMMAPKYTPGQSSPDICEML